MGIFSRFRELLKAKAHAALERWEDPEQLLDHSYEKLLEERKRIDRAVRDAITHRNLIRGEIADLKKKLERLHERAKLYRLKALTLEREAGDKDKAQVERYNREALRLLAEKARLEERLREAEERLSKAEIRINAMKEKRIDLMAKLEELRHRKEELKSEFRLARAEERITGALAALEGDFGDVDLTLKRVEEKVRQLKARAEASTEMALEATAAAAAETALGGEEALKRELEREDELTLKAERALRELDLELLGEGEVKPGALGPATAELELFTVAISGGGTWAFPAEEKDEIVRKLNEIDEELTRLNAEGKLTRERFDALYGEIFKLIRERGKLVGRDVPRSALQRSEPDLRLPPEDLEFEEALKLLEGRGLIA